MGGGSKGARSGLIAALARGFLGGTGSACCQARLGATARAAQYLLHCRTHGSVEDGVNALSCRHRGDRFDAQL